ncbi:MAG: TetR/AcrR family bet gene transcriptional repressor [Oceanospirillaceae bacterium]|jgi:TetR/AcrR family transcriptional repressor of bet genes
MSQSRKTFNRQSEQKRTMDLILATQLCIERGGIGGASIRRIAEEAGVTPGLVRHYFPDKEALICAAYRLTMEQMFSGARQGVDDLVGSAIEKLRLFINTSLQPTVMNSRYHQLWASFTSLTCSTPAMEKIHHESYLEFRMGCQDLVELVFIELEREVSSKQLEHFGIMVNAILDGLWLEGCLAMELFEDGELAEIGLRSVQSVLSIKGLIKEG